MGFVDELYIGADEAVYHLFRLSFWTQADVVGSLKEDEAGGMVLAKNVAVEALQGRLAQSAFHHAVAPMPRLSTPTGCCRLSAVAKKSVQRSCWLVVLPLPSVMELPNTAMAVANERTSSLAMLYQWSTFSMVENFCWGPPCRLRCTKWCVSHDGRWHAWEHFYRS